MPLARCRTAAAAAALAAAALVPALTAHGASTVTHAPRQHASGVTSQVGWTSSNWSGYAITGSYSAITGQWTVPAVSATKSASYSSAWIGIDGYNNSNLIQTGTESDWYSGSAHYYAWWEILPAAETRISLPVKAGDHMSASITKGAGSTWTITITDTTTGQSFTTAQSYSGAGTSAEWIEEAPTVGGRVATLAHYGTDVFDNGTVNGGNPGLVAADAGAMVQKGVQVSTPSNPDSDTDGFKVAYGSSVPPTPGS